MHRAVESNLGLGFKIRLVDRGGFGPAADLVERFSAHHGEKIGTPRRIDHDLGKTRPLACAGRERDRIGICRVFKPQLVRQLAEKLAFAALLLELDRHARGTVLAAACIKFFHCAARLAVPLVKVRHDGQLLLQPHGDLIKAFKQQRIKVAALARMNHAHRLFVRKRLFIAPLARERVVNVRD